MYVDSNV